MEMKSIGHIIAGIGLILGIILILTISNAMIGVIVIVASVIAEGVIISISKKDGL